jgi:hypothetical protein
MKKSMYFIGLMVVTCLSAQDKQAVKYAKTITADDLKTHLSVLASDEYEGRETGTRGQKKAAEYISNHFKSLGFEGPVDGSYYQTFYLNESLLAGSYFKKGDEKMVNYEDFVYRSSSETNGEEYIQVMMASSSDFKAIPDQQGKYLVFLLDDMNDFQELTEKANEAGAAGYLMVITDDQTYSSVLARTSSYMKRPRLRMGERDNSSGKMIVSDASLVEWIFGKEMDQIAVGESVEVIFNADYLDKPIPTENVLGYLKGTEKPDELLIITSHYDHIGISSDGQINNGADDDGSGTVSVLEVAEAFAKAAEKNRGPKRSILFMTVTGEEKGLLGSRHYTDVDPVFPLANTVANLNIDMVGRVDEAHADDPDYVYLIGSDKLSQELHELSEMVNETYTDINLDYTYNDENDPNRFYYRSDHYNFAKNNIPIIFYFNGTHPDYHRPTDTVDKIRFDVMEKRARLVFHTAWEVANRSERIKVD